MTLQPNNKDDLTTPVDMTKDQVQVTRRVLQEMNDKADRAIDETRRLTTKG